MKVKYRYELTFAIAGVSFSYACIAAMFGFPVKILNGDNVYQVREDCTRVLRHHGFENIESEIKCYA